MSKSRTIAANLGTTSGEGDGGVTVYATKENLPTSGLTSGDQAYVSGNRRLYISNGSGWYNVALVNATPSLTIDPTGAITLSTEGTATTITLTATDSDNAVDGLTFSVDSDGSFGGLATVSQDSSVFTITPLSEDSATTTSSTLTFKASDGISFGSGTRTLSLTFATSNSNYITFLAKADTAGTDTQIDASSNASTVGVINTITSTAYTPYHPGGYSTYFDGTGDYLTVPGSTDFDFGTNAFTVEWWQYWNGNNGNGYTTLYSNNYTQSGGIVIQTDNNVNKYITYLNGTGTTIAESTAATANQWYHYALVRNGNTFTFYRNGTAAGTATLSVSIGSSVTQGIFAINNGTLPISSSYIRDFRIVKGTAVYTSAFTPPTESLTAVTNTSLLTCHLPYIADGSSSSHSITVAGNTNTERFAPYDYLGYTKADHGGSVYFEGSDDYLTVDAGYLATNTTWWNSSGFTIEAWLYKEDTNSTTIWDNRQSGTTGILFQMYSDGLHVYSNNAWRAQSYGTGRLNTWTHIALVCSGTTGKLFQDGVQVGSDFTVPDTASHTYFGRSQNTIGATQYTPRGGGTDYKGYISDLRISSGSRYTGTFTPSTEPFADDGTTVFLTCTNKNDIWDAGQGTRLLKSGSMTASNTQRKFITSSAMYFDGANDSITRSDLEMGSGDLTFEFWMYQNFAQGNDYRCMLAASTYGSGVPFTIYTYSSNVQVWLSASGSAEISGAFTAFTWHHIALVRNSGTWTLYIDGTSAGTSTTGGSYNFAATTDWRFGENHSGSYDYNGFMQDMRFTKGLARYTTAFTPPTSEFGG